MRCHSRSRTRCDGTPCYSHNEHRSHCVLAGDTRLPRASVALPMLSAHKTHWCHRRQAEHAAVRGSRQTCAATTWNRTRPANPRRHRCDCWTRSPTAEAPTPSGSMHRDAPAVKARERPRQPSCKLERYASNGYMARPYQILRRGQKEKLLFCPEGVHKVFKNQF